MSSKYLHSRRPVVCFMVVPAVLCLLALGMGRNRSQKAPIEAAVRNELDPLTSLPDHGGSTEQVSALLFPDSPQLPPEVTEKVIAVFFSDFSYKIEKIRLLSGAKDAVATVLIKTIDAKSLAKDYRKKILEMQFLSSDPEETYDKDPFNELDSGLNSELDSELDSETYAKQDAERYSDLSSELLSLLSLMEGKKYSIVDSHCEIALRKTQDGWKPVRSPSLENSLSGGFMDYMSDPGLFTASETLTVYLRLLQDLPKTRSALLLSFLSDTSGLDGNDLSEEIARAVSKQLSEHFSFQIISSREDGNEAWVKVKITSIRLSTVLERYSHLLEDYLKSSDAVIDGAYTREQKSLGFLLDAINSSDAIQTWEDTISMFNDGLYWKPEDSDAMVHKVLFDM